MYVGLSKMVKKVPKSNVINNPNEPGEEHKSLEADGIIDPNDDIFVGE